MTPIPYVGNFNLEVLSAKRMLWKRIFNECETSKN